MSGRSSGPIGWGGTLADRFDKKSVATCHHLDCARRRHRRSSNRMDLSGRLSTLKDLVSANGSVGALSGYTMLSRFGHFDSELEQADFNPARAPSFGPAGCLIDMDSSPDLIERAQAGDETAFR